MNNFEDNYFNRGKTSNVISNFEVYYFNMVELQMI